MKEPGRQPRLQSNAMTYPTTRVSIHHGSVIASTPTKDLITMGTNCLLQNEPPLVIQPSLVRALDNLLDAVVLQQLHYWMLRATATYDEYLWVYKTHDEWSQEIGVSANQVRRSLDRLESPNDEGCPGVLISCQPEKSKWQRRKWYRINYDHAMFTSGQIEVADLPDRLADLPDREGEIASSSSYTENTTETTNTNPSSLPLSESTSELRSLEDEPTTTPNPKVPGDRSTPKPKKSTRDLTPVDPSIIQLCELLADLVGENGFTRPNPAKKEWQTACRLMLTRDGRSPEDVEAVIRWCQADSFWYKNIRSMEKLRVQFERLWVEVDGGSKTKRTRTPRPRGNMTARLDAIIAKEESNAD